MLEDFQKLSKLVREYFDPVAVCWMFTRITYSQNNQAVFLMSVNKQKAIKKLPFGEFFVERIIALWPAKGGMQIIKMEI